MSHVTAVSKSSKFCHCLVSAQAFVYTLKIDNHQIFKSVPNFQVPLEPMKSHMPVFSRCSREVGDVMTFALSGKENIKIASAQNLIEDNLKTLIIK